MSHVQFEGALRFTKHVKMCKSDTYPCYVCKGVFVRKYDRNRHAVWCESFPEQKCHSNLVYGRIMQKL